MSKESPILINPIEKNKENKKLFCPISEQLKLDHNPIEFNGNLWTAEDIEMENHTANKKTSSENYSMLLIDELEKYESVLNKLRELFKGRVLVDLGTGVNDGGYRIAGLLGCSGYVAVEPNYFKNLSNLLGGGRDYTLCDNDYLLNRLPDRSKLNNLPFSIVKEDALSFLLSMEDNSACIFSSGMDKIIVKDDKYIERVNDLISRVIGDDNAFLSNYSIFKASNIKGFNIYNWAPSSRGCYRTPEMVLYKKGLKNEI